jgi:hypothetical protein
MSFIDVSFTGVKKVPASFYWDPFPPLKSCSSFEESNKDKQGAKPEKRRTE